MKMICEFNGVRTSSFGLVTAVSWFSAQKLAPRSRSLRLKAPLETPPLGGTRRVAPTRGIQVHRAGAQYSGLAGENHELARSPLPRACVVYLDATGPLPCAALALRRLHS